MPRTLDALKQVAGGLIRKMSPRAVSNTLYGYAALPRTVIYDNRAAAMLDVPLEELEEAIERAAPDMNSQNVANTIYAYGTCAAEGTSHSEARRCATTRGDGSQPTGFVQYNLGILEVRFT